MICNTIGIIGANLFLIGFIYLSLHHFIFKHIFVGKTINNKFYINEIICLMVSVLISVLFFDVSIR